MHPAVPVELQPMLRGLWVGITEHRMQDRPQETLVEGCRGGRMLPHRREVLASGEQPVALLLAQRDLLATQRGELGFDRRGVGEGLVPTPC